jgi:selenocysteine lyase/cysteine desulfurase
MLSKHCSSKHYLSKLLNIPNITYDQGEILNPFNKNYNKIIFADDVASGRPCKLVDELIEKNVFPYYSNTHSNATCGTVMKDLVNKTKEIIKDVMKVPDDKKIIFTGNGCTAAVNHLIEMIDFSVYSKIKIHSSSYEHHSNFLPWVEKLGDHKKYHPDTDIEYIHMDSNETFDLMINEHINDLEKELKHDVKNNINLKKRLDIFTLIGCSNVTGKRYDLSFEKLWRYVKQKKKLGHNMYLLIDCACSAPYIRMDLTKSDGVFFSGHKFLGGQCTPGVLIVDQSLITKNKPYQPGGGCVNNADIMTIDYKQDIENREMCGTPNIVGIIRLGFVLTIKESLMNIIEHNEKIIEHYVSQKMRELEEEYDCFKVIGLENKTNNDLPIYPIIIRGLHYNLITVALNDIFGVQTRGGLSCCGTLGVICKTKYDINGWCRISFNYLLKKHEIDKILTALEFVIKNRHSLKKYYTYDKTRNMYYYDFRKNKNKNILS